MLRMVVVAPGEVDVRDGVLRTPRKFLTGMQMFADLFPGEVTLIGRRPGRGDDNLGSTAVPLDALGFDCRVVDSLEQELRRLDPDVALMSLSDDHAPLVNVVRSSVVSAEHAARSWLAMSTVGRTRPVDRLRMQIGYRRLERRLRRVVRRADGLHCNGVVAWSTFADESRNPLRVYDSRVTAAMLDKAGGKPSSQESGCLRLGFSGRLTPIKGPQFVLDLPEELARRGVEATVDVFGDGPMRVELEKNADPRVRFHGSLDFESEWWPKVAHGGVDLMVLPHVQPDPSGTYLEAAGAGVPVLGFTHETSLDLQRHGFVFVAGERTAQSLADSIADLAREPSRLSAASSAGSRFMRLHTFEADFRQRVDHLVGVATRQSPTRP